MASNEPQLMFAMFDGVFLCMCEAMAHGGHFALQIVSKQCVLMSWTTHGLKEMHCCVDLLTGKARHSRADFPPKGWTHPSEQHEAWC